jgi:hypothetical protein
MPGWVTLPKPTASWVPNALLFAKRIVVSAVSLLGQMTEPNLPSEGGFGMAKITQPWRKIC